MAPVSSQVLQAGGNTNQSFFVGDINAGPRKKKNDRAAVGSSMMSASSGDEQRDSVARRTNASRNSVAVGSTMNNSMDMAGSSAFGGSG